MQATTQYFVKQFFFYKKIALPNFYARHLGVKITGPYCRRTPLHSRKNSRTAKTILLSMKILFTCVVQIPWIVQVCMLCYKIVHKLSWAIVHISQACNCHLQLHVFGKKLRGHPITAIIPILHMCFKWGFLSHTVISVIFNMGAVNPNGEGECCYIKCLRWEVGRVWLVWRKRPGKGVTRYWSIAKLTGHICSIVIPIFLLPPVFSSSKRQTPYV